MIPLIIFYVFAILLIGSASMVILARHAVYSALFLVLAFIASSVLWMLLQAEFLALTLIFVYVGAVMTLFLFVVMMLHQATLTRRDNIMRYLPLCAMIIALLLGLLWIVLKKDHSGLAQLQLVAQPATYSNATTLGEVLYTHYVFAFEIAGAILLVAIIAAISLALRGPQHSRRQRIAKQVAVNPRDRLKLVNVKS